MKPSIIFTAYISISGADSSPRSLISSKTAAFDDLSLTTHISGRTLYVSATSTSTKFTIEAATVNLRTGRSADNYTPDKQNSGNGNSGLVAVYTRVSSSTTNNYEIQLRQFSQGNENNNSWSDDKWYGNYGVQTFYLVAFGTVDVGNIEIPEIPNLGGGSSGSSTFTPACSTKTEKDITPKPEPKPEPEE